MTRLQDVDRLYALLQRAANRPHCSFALSELPPNRLLPRRGVYFLFEEGEVREDGTPRVVRVGTHAVSQASRNTLRARLKSHQGTGSGGGNHRGSILRLRVGEAILSRGDLGASSFPNWGRGSNAPSEIREQEVPLEQAVSNVLSRMRVVVLPVDDEPSPQSQRAYIERNSIALLSNRSRPAIDPPSDAWLGRHSPRIEMRESGLWNTNHVNDTHEPDLIHVLATLVMTQ